MDFIRPIGPPERDVDPVLRVERSREERERRDRERREREAAEDGSKRPGPPAAAAPEPGPDGPVEGDDGQLHVDVRA